MNKLAFVGLCSSLFATTACVAADDDIEDGDDVVTDPSTDPTPTPDPEPEPQPLTAESAYQIDSALDVQAAVVMPQSVYDGVDLLRGLRDNPGETLFDLAEEAGVPAVEEIRSALPSAVEDQLYGWIDGYVQQITTGDGTVAVVIDGIVDASETVLARCELMSELALDAGVATHRLTSIGFDVAGNAMSYDLAGWPTAIVEDTAPATVSGVGADTTLSIGDHTFGLPYGELALRAIEDALVAQRGTDLRGTLGALVDCPTLAATIADKCVWGACVGHETELNEVCEGALDYAVEEIRARFAAARFDAIALHTGTATMVDDDGDGRAERLANGVWTAELDASMGPRPAPATFTGAR